MRCQTVLPNKKKHSYEKTILIVEDDDNIGKFLVTVFSLETSYRPLLVTDGFQALQIAKSIKPSLCITDYRLPEMNGIEFYDQLQNIHEWTQVPVIMMSAYLPTQEMQKRHMIGMSKPFDLDELLDTVDHLLTTETT